MFIKKTINRLRSAGAAGEIVLRADSGSYLADVVTACRPADVRFSITARTIGADLCGQIEAIAEEAWEPIDYFLPGAGVAKIVFTPFERTPRESLSPTRRDPARAADRASHATD